jgi:2-dehydro-3-deoxyphosphooctonate aldolase (KDO 8-P synthase)
VVESEEVCIQVASTLKDICEALDIFYIFKSSYRKANRTRLDSFSGLGDPEALAILKKVREQCGVPVLTDIHSVAEVDQAAAFVDVLQIPAFLCRQTDLLLKAGYSGLPVNIKKGQFLSGSAMAFAAEKVASTGNQQILLTERGNSFGYGDLVVDLRNIVDMKTWLYPVILDATHAVQRPNQLNGVSGGDPSYIEALSLAGMAVGADGLFLETHPDPASALSDGTNMIRLDRMESLLRKAVSIRKSLR